MMVSRLFQMMKVNFQMVLYLFQYITVSAFSSEMISINNRKDQRISQCFPNDPYSNICIVTTTQKLYLQHAFLSMDSGYFAQIDPDAPQVDLRELQEAPLVRVLHALYGEVLVANSVGELAELLPIILYLEIQQYRKNAEKEVLSRKDLLENVEMIELAFKHKFLWQEILQTHIQNNLSILENSKSYLQLGRIQTDTFKAILSEYILKVSDKNERVLNNVMENYFNRKGIKAIQFLQQNNLAYLLKVWMSYHHAILSFTSLPKTMQTAKYPQMRKSQTTAPTQMQKKAKIKALQIEIASKDAEIDKMIKDIKMLKAQLGIRQKLGTAQSLFIIEEAEKNRSKDKQSQQKDSRRTTPFKSCIYTQHFLGEKKSSPKWKAFNRFGSKNIKKWA